MSERSLASLKNPHPPLFRGGGGTLNPSVISGPPQAEPGIHFCECGTMDSGFDAEHRPGVTDMGAGKKPSPACGRAWRVSAG